MKHFAYNLDLISAEVEFAKEGSLEERRDGLEINHYISIFTFMVSLECCRGIHNQSNPIVFHQYISRMLRRFSATTITRISKVKKADITDISMHAQL